MLIFIGIRVSYPAEVKLKAVEMKIQGIGEGTGKVTTIAGVNPNKKIITGSSAGEDEDGPANFCIVSFNEN